MRVQYSVDPKSQPVRIAAAFFILSFALRFTWCIFWPEEAGESGLLLHGILPLGACLMFVLCVLRWGRTALWTSFFPVVLGVIFFALKADDFVWWHQMLCALLYLLVAVLYGLTVFGVAAIRKLLIPLFGLPLLFHLFVEDLILYRTIYTLPEWLQELSVLCIMAGLFSLSLAMRERKPSKADANHRG